MEAVVFFISAAIILAVVAVFFKLGDANPDLAKLLANIPTKDQDAAIKKQKTHPYSIRRCTPFNDLNKHPVQ